VGLVVLRLSLRLRRGRNVLDVIALPANPLHMARARPIEHRFRIAHVTAAVGAFIAMINHRNFGVTNLATAVNILLLVTRDISSDVITL
jgi:hypothetical protein